ncbi:hypothetical protein BASA61_009840 [Batrachochytrium salamandrivorans]|nr:hypothetical protein BASA61_009840 [Batrachochytrium salamandrivorans]KAH9265295.1 hypothetical protein BASA83_011197 [Batrachochytrium salamandrivorans]KAJ1342869.1 hypothetical protein BSLG_002528 [Batrachochytrium salamandrivorans]
MTRIDVYTPKKPSYIIPLFHHRRTRLATKNKSRVVYLAILCVGTLLWTIVCHKSPSLLDHFHQPVQDPSKETSDFIETSAILPRRTELLGHLQNYEARSPAGMALSWEKDLDITEAYVNRFRADAPPGTPIDTLYIPGSDPSKRGRNGGSASRFDQSVTDAALAGLGERIQPPPPTAAQLEKARQIEKQQHRMEQLEHEQIQQQKEYSRLRNMSFKGPSGSTERMQPHGRILHLDDIENSVAAWGMTPQDQAETDKVNAANSLIDALAQLTFEGPAELERASEITKQEPVRGKRPA